MKNVSKKIFTIGFTQKPARKFFSLLKENGVKSLIDTRLRPDGQLSGFAKAVDLEYFAPVLSGAGYSHAPELAPSDEDFSLYKAKKISWADYELLYVKKISVIKDIDRFANDGCGCFLCSEHDPAKCHRRLLAEFIAKNYNGFEIVHLK